MFNEYIFIQFLIVLFLFLFFFNYEQFFLIINAIIFLILISIYAWLEDLDILINFLLIIDLGLFLILFVFIINSINLFSFFKSNINFTIFFNIFILFIVCWFFFKIFFQNFNSTFYIINLFVILYQDWFFLFQLLFFTDLQLLSEIYFNFNFFEFIIMNIIIYLTIIFVYYITYFNVIKNAFNFKFSFFLFLKKKIINNTFFLKNQQFQKQLITPIKTRVWTKLIKNNSIYDSKTNLIKFIR